MNTPTLNPATEDYGEAGRTAFVLVNEPAWGILLPNSTLYQEEELPLDDPWSAQPTVWHNEFEARSIARAIAGMLERRYGIPTTWPTEIRVVQLELDTDGLWKIPQVVSAAHAGYRPMNLDTGEMAEFACDAKVLLTVDQARQVVRDHKECAGQITCKIRGRARAVLASAGVWKLNRSPRVWQSLNLPEMAR